MARPKRAISSTGLYHIMFRGNNKQVIFHSQADCDKILKIIRECKKKFEFEIYAYCIMSNHVHLFLKEQNQGDVSKIMQTILTTYAVWYNFKYERTGALFESRYKSEVVEDDKYCLGLIRYIHQNPVKAMLVDNVASYKWSSYNSYLNYGDELVETEFIMSMFSDNIGKFINFNNQSDDVDYDIDSNVDTKICRQIKSELGIEPKDIAKLPLAEKYTIIKKLVDAGISKSALERITGINRKIISKL